MATARKSVTGAHHDAPQLLGGTAIKPVERHGMEAIRYFIHNPETGAYFSRTPKSWFLIFLFYVIYYTCLGGFWYGMLQVFFMSLNDETPKWMQEQSIIGTNPGMGVRPRQADSKIDSSMYLLRGNFRNTSNLEEDSDGGFAARMADFLDKFNDQGNAVECSADDLNTHRGPGEPPCKFDISNFGDCATFPYGFNVKANHNSPCVIVKLNRIFGLIPNPYNENDRLSDEIPENIKQQIQSSEPRRIYIECHGENAADVEALENKIKYFPEHQGIPLGYFPHQDRSNKVSPSIAVQFKDIPRGQLLHVECKAWFQGVVHARKERMGLVHFELLSQ